MRQNIWLARLAALFAVSACAAVTPCAFAAAEKAPAGEKSGAANASRQAYEAATKSFAAGKYQPAIDQFSAALRSGGLASPEMAKALYLRGLAYKKQGKPGLAISDLTSALWLKNGLSESDRKTATAERTEAYQQAGLGSGPTGNEGVAVADPNVPTAPPAVAPPPAPSAKQAIPAPIPPSVTTANGITRQSPDSEAAKDAARARIAAANPVDAGGLQSAAVAPVLSDNSAKLPAAQQAAVADAATPPATGLPPGPADSSVATSSAAQPLAAVPTEAEPQPASPQPLASVQNAVTGFFSNIFGGGTGSGTQQAGSTVTTASTTPVEPQTSSWNDSVTVSGKDGASGKRTIAVSAQVAAPQKQAKKSAGKYKVHIAAMRSRAEAEALAKKVSATHAADLADHSATVDEAVIGSMGTFYRVRIGGYASQEEPRGLCDKLRNSGFDCLVVTN